MNLDGMPLSVVTFTATNIEAQLAANQAAGSFLLQVKASSGQVGSFDATIGTTGPQGIRTWIDPSALPVPYSVLPNNTANRLWPQWGRNVLDLRDH